jgi:hypothetical protein
MVGMLTALPGTALWRRLKTEGRLRQHSNGDQFYRPNFTPMMDERALLRGYAELMKWLYSPKAYYSRCEAYLSRAGSSSETRSSNLGEVGALLRTIWHIGVLSPRRLLFWRLMVKAIFKGRSHIRQAVAHAVQGEHLILYTCEHVVPRMERALAEIHTGIEPDLRPLPSEGNGLPVLKKFGSPRTAGNVHVPEVRQAKVHPLPTHSSEVN